MKCENCAHMVSEGYEYPEYYCELGIADCIKYAKYDTGDGCTVPKRKRIQICEKMNNSEFIPGLWWDESKEKKC
ncbi:MAG: hypothetical protein RR275_09290 [Lachnospiraceae bacterium]